MIAANVMTANPITVRQDSSVRDTIATLKQHRLHDLPVVDGEGKPVGMITARAILHAAVPVYATGEMINVMRGGPDLPSVYEHLRSITGMAVSEIMDGKPDMVSCQTATTAVAAMLVNMDTDSHNVLVVDEDGILVGIISALDIVSRAKT